MDSPVAPVDRISQYGRCGACRCQNDAQRRSRKLVQLDPGGRAFAPGIKALSRNIPPICQRVKNFFPACGRSEKTSVLQIPTLQRPSVEVDEALSDGPVAALGLRLDEAIVGTVDEIVDRLRPFKGNQTC